MKLGLVFTSFRNRGTNNDSQQYTGYETVGFFDLISAEEGGYVSQKLHGNCFLGCRPYNRKGTKLNSEFYVFLLERFSDNSKLH